MMSVKDLIVGFSFANEDLSHFTCGADSMLADEANKGQSCSARATEGKCSRSIIVINILKKLKFFCSVSF